MVQQAHSTLQKKDGQWAKMALPIRGCSSHTALWCAVANLSQVGTKYFLRLCVLAFLWFVLPAGGNLFAQQATLLRLEEGLKTKATGTLIKDRKGNIWIASYNGLHKHEGNRIFHFAARAGMPNSLSGLELHALYEDKQGYIWAGGLKALNRIDPITHAVQQYPLPTDVPLSSYGYVYSIFQADTDSIWISTDAALLMLHPGTGQYRLVPVNTTGSGVPNPQMSYINGMQTPEGLWMRSTRGVVFYNYATRLFEQAAYNPGQKKILALADSVVFGNPAMLTMDDKQHLWWVHNHRLLARYHIPTGQLDTLALPKPEGSWPCCESIALDKQGKVWVGFRHGGILIADMQQGIVDSLRYRGQNSLLPSNYVHSILQDDAGHMWVSTDNGIAIVQYYGKGKSKKIISNEPAFQSLAYQGGTITTDGLGQLYLPFYNFGYYKLEQRTGKLYSFPRKANDPGGLFYILPDQNNIPLMAQAKGLFPARPGSIALPYGHQLAAINEVLTARPGHVMWSYFADSNQAFFKKSSGLLVHYKKAQPPAWHSCIGFRKNVCVSADSSALWWLNDTLGLCKLDLRSGAISIGALAPSRTLLACAFSNPRDMLDDGESLWITSQAGLVRYFHEADTAVCYAEKDGLAHGFTFALLMDRAKHVWVASLGGIDVYNPATQSFQSIERWPPESYMDAFGSTVQDAQGILHFCIGNKLLSYDPDQVFAFTNALPILKINQVLAGGRAIDWQQPLQMPFDYNNLVVRYGVLDFVNQASLEYLYKLGAEGDYTRDALRGELQFSNLAPGAYTLYLKARYSASGVETPALRLQFEVLPPWYKSWWFRLLLSMVLVGMSVGLVLQRIRAIRRKAAIAQELAELEGKALRAQMNPHFIFNSLNAIQELVVTEKNEEAYEYLTRFSRLLRKVLHHSEQKWIRLGEELQVLEWYLALESLRFQHAFTYAIEVPAGLDTEDYEVPPMILQPFVENAIWHGLSNKEGPKHLSIRVEAEKQILVCTIEDNGIGREAAQKIKAAKLGAGNFASRGMLLSQKRIDLLNQELPMACTLQIIDKKDAYGHALGTLVILSFGAEPQNE